MNASIARGALLTLAAAALAMSLSSCWYAKQATRFLAERAGATPTDRVASDPETSESVAAFLALVEDVRRFSVEYAGLEPTKNYTRYIVTDKGYVADVVSACASDSFERHYWRYPIIGALPYKGFYDRTDAVREADRLKAAGLDVIIRKVDAFSSLGYFKDPLYSFMADYEEDAIAELVIHESAHATLFVRGADQFNEEFATFVGREGAKRYIERRYGPDSDAAEARLNRKRDGETFVAFLKETAGLLEAVYADTATDRQRKLERKAEILAERARTFRQRAGTLFRTEAYGDFDMGAINNAYIDLYRLYEEDLGLYEAWFERVANGSLPAFVSSLKALAGTAGSGVKDAMRGRLEMERQAAAQGPDEGGDQQGQEADGA